MSVHYKFKSAVEFDTLPVDGVNISVEDLKEAIIQQKRLGRGQSDDLQITNAETKEVYTNNKTLIPKNSSLIVARVPVDPSLLKKPWDNKEPTALLLSNPSNLMNTDEAAVAAEIDRKIQEVTDLTRMDGSENDKINAMVAQSTMEFHPSKYVKLRVSRMTGPVPQEYKCFKCHGTGHWLSNCPISNDMRRSTGIPSKFLEVCDSNAPGVMINSSGNFVRRLDSEMPCQEKSIPPPDSRPPDPKILCQLCERVLNDAVLIPCCAEAFCDECIRNRLVESEDTSCPKCAEENILPENLIPNRYLRGQVKLYYMKRSEPDKKSDKESTDDVSSAPLEPLSSNPHTPVASPHPSQSPSGSPHPIHTPIRSPHRNLTPTHSPLIRTHTPPHQPLTPTRSPHHISTLADEPVKKGETESDKENCVSASLPLEGEIGPKGEIDRYVNDHTERYEKDRIIKYDKDDRIGYEKSHGVGYDNDQSEGYDKDRMEGYEKDHSESYDKDRTEEEHSHEDAEPNSKPEVEGKHKKNKKKKKKSSKHEEKGEGKEGKKRKDRKHSHKSHEGKSDSIKDAIREEHERGLKDISEEEVWERKRRSTSVHSRSKTQSPKSRSRTRSRSRDRGKSDNEGVYDNIVPFDPSRPPPAVLSKDTYYPLPVAVNPTYAPAGHVPLGMPVVPQTSQYIPTVQYPPGMPPSTYHPTPTYFDGISDTLTLFNQHMQEKDEERARRLRKSPSRSPRSRSPPYRYHSRLRSPRGHSYSPSRSRSRTRSRSRSRSRPLKGGRSSRSPGRHRRSRTPPLRSHIPYRSPRSHSFSRERTPPQHSPTLSRSPSPSHRIRTPLQVSKIPVRSGKDSGPGYPGGRLNPEEFARFQQPPFAGPPPPGQWENRQPQPPWYEGHHDQFPPNFRGRGGLRGRRGRGGGYRGGFQHFDQRGPDHPFPMDRSAPGGGGDSLLGTPSWDAPQLDFNRDMGKGDRGGRALDSERRKYADKRDVPRNFDDGRFRREREQPDGIRRLEDDPGHKRFEEDWKRFGDGRKFEDDDDRRKNFDSRRGLEGRRNDEDKHRLPDGDPWYHGQRKDGFRKEGDFRRNLDSPRKGDDDLRSHLESKRGDDRDREGKYKPLPRHKEIMDDPYRSKSSDSPGKNLKKSPGRERREKDIDRDGERRDRDGDKKDSSKRDREGGDMERKDTYRRERDSERRFRDGDRREFEGRREGDRKERETRWERDHDKRDEKHGKDDSRRRDGERVRFSKWDRPEKDNKENDRGKEDRQKGKSQEKDESCQAEEKEKRKSKHKDEKQEARGNGEKESAGKDDESKSEKKKHDKKKKKKEKRRASQASTEASPGEMSVDEGEEKKKKKKRDKKKKLKGHSSETDKEKESQVETQLPSDQNTDTSIPAEYDGGDGTVVDKEQTPDVNTEAPETNLIGLTLPAPSKWERDEEILLTPKSLSEKKEPEEYNKVTVDILKRAENAIFSGRGLISRKVYLEAQKQKEKEKEPTEERSPTPDWERSEKGSDMREAKKRGPSIQITISSKTESQIGRRKGGKSMPSSPERPEDKKLLAKPKRPSDSEPGEKECQSEIQGSIKSRRKSEKEENVKASEESVISDQPNIEQKSPPPDDSDQLIEDKKEPLIGASLLDNGDREDNESRPRGIKRPSSSADELETKRPKSEDRIFSSENTNETIPLSQTSSTTQAEPTLATDEAQISKDLNTKDVQKNADEKDEAKMETNNLNNDPGVIDNIKSMSNVPEDTSTEQVAEGKVKDTSVLPEDKAIPATAQDTVTAVPPADEQPITTISTTIPKPITSIPTTAQLNITPIPSSVQEPITTITSLVKTRDQVKSPQTPVQSGEEGQIPEQEKEITPTVAQEIPSLLDNKGRDIPSVLEDRGRVIPTILEDRGRGIPSVLEDRGRDFENRERSMEERGKGIENRGRGMEDRGRGMDNRGRGIEDRGRPIDDRGRDFPSHYQERAREIPSLYQDRGREISSNYQDRGREMYHPRGRGIPSYYQDRRRDIPLHDHRRGSEIPTLISHHGPNRDRDTSPLPEPVDRHQLDDLHYHEGLHSQAFAPELEGSPTPIPGRSSEGKVRDKTSKKRKKRKRSSSTSSTNSSTSSSSSSSSSDNEEIVKKKKKKKKKKKAKAAVASDSSDGETKSKHKKKKKDKKKKKKKDKKKKSEK